MPEMIGCPARFPPAPCPMRSSSTTIGCLPYWLPPANQTSSTSSRTATPSTYRAKTRRSRCTSTGTTLPYLTGEVDVSPRRVFFYFSDDGDLVAMRFENWKIVFLEQRCQGTLRIWAEPFTPLRVPKLFNLRTDPFEYADLTSNTYYDWFLRHDYFVFYATAMATKFLETSRSSRPGTHRPASPSTTRWRSCTRSWRRTRCSTRGETGAQSRRSSSSSDA